MLGIAVGTTLGCGSNESPVVPVGNLVAVVVELKLSLATLLQLVIVGREVGPPSGGSVLLHRHGVVDRSVSLNISLNIEGVVLGVYVVVLAYSHGHRHLALALYGAVGCEYRLIARCPRDIGAEQTLNWQNGRLLKNGAVVERKIDLIGCILDGSLGISLDSPYLLLLGVRLLTESGRTA